MAWTCSGRTNSELISNLKSAGLITSTLVSSSMSKVDRANYVPSSISSSESYKDSPISIGYSATCSAPHMHAHATESLLDHLKPGMKVLDVGSGSAYLAAVFHHLVNPNGNGNREEEGKGKGKVVGIDHIQQLVDFSRQNLKKDGLGQELENGRIEMICGDGRKGEFSSATLWVQR